MNPPFTSVGMIMTPRARCNRSRALDATPVATLKCWTALTASSTACCSSLALASWGIDKANAATATIRMRLMGLVPPVMVGWLELDACLSLDAGPERMLHELHLCDKICDLDEFGLGVAAGDDDVEVARLRLELGHHLLDRQVIVA